MEEFRLGVVEVPYSTEHHRFKGMLSIPNILLGQDFDTRVVGVKFRQLDPSQGRVKYDQPKNQIARLFNLRALSSAADTIVLTEGEFDCIVASHVGFDVVGIPGAQNWGKGHAYRFKLLEGFSRVILCRDSDDAGDSLVKALEPTDGLEVRSMLPYKDINDFYMARGPEALRDRINGDTSPTAEEIAAGYMKAEKESDADDEPESGGVDGSDDDEAPGPDLDDA